MASYMLVISAYVYDVLQIGLIGTRGRIILALVGGGLLFAAAEKEWLGLALAVGTVLGLRRLGRWFRDEQGAQILLMLAQEWFMVAAGYVGDMMRWVCAILLPATREAASAPVFHAEPVTPVPYDTAYATPQMMRWTPGWTPPAEAAGTAQVSPMASLETYASVIAEVASNDRPFNETAVYVADRFKVSRSKFARDVRARREEIAA